MPWCISDGGIIASGLGYNGYDVTHQKHKFDRIINVHILGVELGLSPSVMMQVRITILTFMLHYIALEPLNPFMAEALHF